MECLKLISSPKFPDKRVGYLGLALLLDETVDVLTLVTNSLSNDLNHSLPYVVGLALVALGNIGSREMLRDLSATIGKMLSETSTPYIRKKAALCTVRLFRKEPDLIEDFIDRAISLLSDKDHAVIMTGVTLLTEIAENHKQEHIKKLRSSKCVARLVKILRGLVQGGFSAEHETGGITDPHLQVRVLRLLGLLGAGSSSASEAMSDVLAVVASTDGAKNTGNAILYECVRTIMSIEADNSLRVLAVNILGRFLSTKDNNIRYVALHTLGSVISVDTKAVQRHKSTIIACLRDPDVSIRTQALGLIYDLFNEENVEMLTSEVLIYLSAAPRDQIYDVCSRLAEVIADIPISRKWYIDTLVEMVSVAGDHSPVFVWQHAITLIGQPSSAACRPHTVHNLFVLLGNKISQKGLVNVAVWTIGEYGDLLLRPPPSDCNSESTIRTPTEIIDLLEKTQRLHSTSSETKGMILNAYLKLSTRFGSSNNVADNGDDEMSVEKRLESLVATFSKSINVDLQARSTEYSGILLPEFAARRPGWLAPMAVPGEEEMRKMYAQFASSKNKGSDGNGAKDSARGDDDEEEEQEQQEDAPEEEEESSKSKVTKKGGNEDHGKKRTKEFAKNDSKKAASSLIDLEQLFGGVPSSVSVPNNGGLSSTEDILGLMGTTPASSTTSFVAFQKDELKITFDLSKEDNAVLVTAHFANSSSIPLTSFVFQAAVPK
jgi:AP-1 complex subunit gamma-1